MKKFSILMLLVLLPALFLPQAALSEEAETVYFAPFSAENVRGEGNVTDAIFAEAEITIVNFWATWCPPCVEELPDLAKISQETEGRAQVLGVLMDGIQFDGDTPLRDEEALKAMHELLDGCDATFAVILPEDPLLTSIASIITAVPTSFIISAEGEILDYVVGSRSASEWLEIVEKVQ